MLATHAMWTWTSSDMGSKKRWANSHITLVTIWTSAKLLLGLLHILCAHGLLLSLTYNSLVRFYFSLQFKNPMPIP